jgi:hypothetical protein
LRILAIGIVVFFSAASLAGRSAMANEYRCFDDENVWCASTTRASAPEMGWSAISKARLRSLVVETVIDARNNQAALRVHVSPITPIERVAVSMSIRKDREGWEAWQDFTATVLETKDGRVHLVLNRAALVAVLEAPDDAHLYVFIQVDNGNNSYRVSRKISLDSLNAALSFARTGR